MREYYRKKLNKLLGSAGDEDFTQLLWATHALQSDYSDAARPYFLQDSVPEEAVTKDMSSRFFVQKWELETLVNELMTVPKVEHKTQGATRTLRCDHFLAAIQCANWLRKLENVEYRIQKKRQDIFIELGRIAARQFDWQRGYANVPQFYRNAFVYAQGECASYFERQHGITINRFSKIGFMLFASFTKNPVFMTDTSWEEFGVTKEEVKRVLELIALPFSEAAKQARVDRRQTIHTADKPSIIRKRPCLRFGENGKRVRAPLPELILERVTSGVFYDVIGGGDRVTNDYGKRFEEYCFRYLSETLTKLTWGREYRYGTKKHPVDSPDILCSEGGKVIIGIECKATRMSQEAMFGKNPINARGYEDLTKAVFQLWRFFSHCRLGKTDREVSDGVLGVVLTLDNWLIMANTLRKRVLEDAGKLADERDPDITEIDRKPIVFVAIPELERTLSVATEETFKEALTQANLEKFLGWRLDGVLQKITEGDEVEGRDYPFAGDLGGLLPWWNEVMGGNN